MPYQDGGGPPGSGDRPTPPFVGSRGRRRPFPTPPPADYAAPTTARPRGPNSAGYRGWKDRPPRIRAPFGILPRRIVRRDHSRRPRPRLRGEAGPQTVDLVH